MHALGIFCLMLAAIAPLAGAADLYDHPLSTSEALRQFQIPASPQPYPEGDETMNWNGITLPIPHYIPPLTPFNLTPVSSPLSEFYGNLNWSETSDAGWNYLFKNKPLPRGAKWLTYPPSGWT